MNQQLTLAIQLNDEATFEDYDWGNNLQLQQHVNHLLLNPDYKPLLVIWGAPGCGKSHLLQACCQAYTHSPAFYLPLKSLQDLGPQVMEGIEDGGLLCIDDLDTIANDPSWEEALFYLYNRVRDQASSTLIVTMHTPPAQTNIQLADLRSRLSWGLVLQLNELDDQHKIQALQRHAQNRGFELSTSVAQYLISRCARNMHDLHQLLNQLDESSLALQRKITIPFVKSILRL